MLGAVLAVTGLCLAGAIADPDMVGKIERSRPASAIETGADPRPAAPDAPFALGERLTAGADGRIEARLRDDTVLYVGSNATLVVDRLVYAEGGSRADAALSLARGAFRLVSGDANKQDGGRLTVETPVASVGIRGTDVWFGSVDGAFSVFLLRGRVEVTTDAGSVVLDEPGEGLTVAGRDRLPSAPQIWDAGKRARALSQTAF